MSTNLVNKTTGELVTLANGTRMWIGTQLAHDLAVQQGTMPNNCMVCITDDFYDGEGTQFVGRWTFTEAGTQNAETLASFTADRDGILSIDVVNSSVAASSGGYYYFFVGSYQVPNSQSSNDDSNWSSADKTVSHKLMAVSAGATITITRQKNAIGTLVVNLL